MEEIKINDINYEVRKNLTDGICLMGSTIYSLNLLLEKKNVSKKEMREILTRQLKYIEMIEKSKDDILLKLYAL